MARYSRIGQMDDVVGAVAGEAVDTAVEQVAEGAAERFAPQQRKKQSNDWDWLGDCDCDFEDEDGILTVACCLCLCAVGLAKRFCCRRRRTPRGLSRSCSLSDYLP